MNTSAELTATEISAAVHAGSATAVGTATAAIERIGRFGAELGAVTEVFADRALRRAADIDAELAAGRDPGPLAGVPFGVKDMYDVEGVTTIAGSTILADDSPAAKDAAAIRRLEQAGAVLVSTFRMDEFAYNFTSQNSHYGLIRNPHDLDRMAGGSSSGSASAAAAGLVPLAVGSDTNGSIRVPAALCGLFSWKPTFGTVSRAGSYPFVDSLDCVGMFARSVPDLLASLEALQGTDRSDPCCHSTIVASAADNVRIGVLGGYFRQSAVPEVFAALDQVAAALGTTRTVELPRTAQARGAAQLVTASTGGQLHLDHLRHRGRDFDPVTRDRLLAGALLPADAYLASQRLRRAWCTEINEAMREVDVLLAPAVPFPAPLHGEKYVDVDGAPFLIAPNLGLFTQPISLAGVPVVTVPIQRLGGTPVGVQVIARPYEDRTALAVAARLEQAGVARAPVPERFREI